MTIDHGDDRSASDLGAGRLAGQHISIAGSPSPAISDGSPRVGSLGIVTPHGFDKILEGSEEFGGCCHVGTLDEAGNFIVNGEVTNANQIASAVMGNPSYSAGQAINLVTCHGARGAAKELEEMLGAPVRGLLSKVDLDPLTDALRDTTGLD